jgi:hypothetical protein
MSADDPRGTDPARPDPPGGTTVSFYDAWGRLTWMVTRPPGADPLPPDWTPSPPPPLPRLDEEDPDEPFVVDG